jgi:hypothetical protein
LMLDFCCRQGGRLPRVRNATSSPRHERHRPLQ